MARINIPHTQLLGTRQDDFLELVFTTLGASGDGGEVEFTRGLMIIAWNSHASNSVNVSFPSVADSQGRVEANADALLPGQRRMYGPFLKEGWIANNRLLIDHGGGTGVLEIAAIDPVPARRN